MKNTEQYGKMIFFFVVVTINSHAENSGQPQDILDAHNQYRRALNIDPLEWSEPLSRSARSWANYLAKSGTLQHSENTAYGENLAVATIGHLSASQMVDLWGKEKQYFIPGRSFPNVSRTGHWKDVGHYTQVVWENTKSVGCGLARDKENNYLVCHYQPAGNVMGKKVY